MTILTLLGSLLSLLILIGAAVVLCLKQKSKRKPESCKSKDIENGKGCTVPATGDSACSKNKTDKTDATDLLIAESKESTTAEHKSQDTNYGIGSILPWVRDKGGSKGSSSTFGAGGGTVDATKSSTNAGVKSGAATTGKQQGTVTATASKVTGSGTAAGKQLGAGTGTGTSMDSMLSQEP